MPHPFKRARANDTTTPSSAKRLHSIDTSEATGAAETASLESPTNRKTSQTKECPWAPARPKRKAVEIDEGIRARVNAANVSLRLGIAASFEVGARAGAPRVEAPLTAAIFLALPSPTARSSASASADESSESHYLR